MNERPDMSLWQREHDGSYAAEINGWHLTVRFRPESKSERRGFFFIATGPLGQAIEPREIHEEIECAMASAIAATRD